MFDIRFSTDCMVDRIGKVCSFGVLTAIAMCGVLYDTEQVLKNHTAFQILSLVLMVSRVFLFVQYTTVAFQVWKYKKARRVLLLTGAALLFFAMLFFGLSFCFSKRASNHYLTFYYAL